MTTAIKRRRGTTTQHSTFTGLVGELTVDTTKNTVVVHDGSTAGGFPLAKENNPTFTGSATFSSGTANGVAYLNGSKVLTTGSALTFDGTNLGTSGNISISGSGSKAVNITTTSGGGVPYLSLTTSGVGSQYIYGNVGSSPNITFEVGGSEQMRLTSTGLGIGTSSPGAKLEVKVAAVSSANAIFSNGQNAQTLTLANSYSYNADGGGSAVVSSGALLLRANSNSLLLDSSGNLGLGVTPSAWGSTARALQLSTRTSVYEAFAGSGFANNVYFDGTNDKYIQSAGAFKLSIGAGGAAFLTAPSGTAGNAISFTQAMTLSSAGELFINESSPGYSVANRGLVEVNGASSALFGLRVGSVNKGYLFHDATNLYLRNEANGFLSFGTNSTENMRIASDGKVGIGSTSPTSKLQVVGLPVYANNSAAVAGGLTAGAFYRTGADPDPVCVVH